MSKLRILYILSLIVLGVLLVFTVFRPMISGGKYSEIQREQLLQSEDGYVIQFDIKNYEGRETDYTINILIDGQPSTITATVKDEGSFTYIKHINRDRLNDGVVSLTIHKEGQESPFEEAIYYLK